MQHFCQIILFILPGVTTRFCCPRGCQSAPIFRIEMDIHFIKDRILCAAFVQYFVDCRHLCIFMRIADMQGLRYTSLADDNQRRTIAACCWHPVIWLIFIASSSVIQRERSPGECFTSSRSSVQICSNDQRRARPSGNDFKPATHDSVNQLIQRPMEERAPQDVLATSLTRAPRCSVSMAASLRHNFYRAFYGLLSV